MQDLETVLFVERGNDDREHCSIIIGLPGACTERPSIRPTARSQPLFDPQPFDDRLSVRRNGHFGPQVVAAHGVLVFMARPLLNVIVFNAE